MAFIEKIELTQRIEYHATWWVGTNPQIANGAFRFLANEPTHKEVALTSWLPTYGADNKNWNWIEII